MKPRPAVGTKATCDRARHIFPARKGKPRQAEARYFLRLGAERILVTATHRQMLALVCAIRLKEGKP